MTGKGRLEAFSDGVMAIAITLLVLDLVVPPASQLDAEHLTLWQALGREWPSYAAYVTSFLVIGIIWVNHHTLFGLIGQVDRVLLFVNLLLLMVVSVIPFPTRLLAEYLTAGDASAHSAAAVYGVTMLALAASFTGLFVAIARPHVLRGDLDVAVVRRQLPGFAIGMVVYTLLLPVAFISAPLMLLGDFLIVVYYVFDQVGANEPGAEPTGG